MELQLTRRSGEPMNFASLNTALLQRAYNPSQKPYWARPNPSPSKHQTARFLNMPGSF